LQIPHYHPTLAEIVTYPAESLMEQLSAGWKDSRWVSVDLTCFFAPSAWIFQSWTSCAIRC